MTDLFDYVLVRDTFPGTEGPLTRKVNQQITERETLSALDVLAGLCRCCRPPSR